MAQQDEQYQQALARVRARKSFFYSLTVYVIINVIFLFVAGEDWLWVTLFWGFGLAIWGLELFVGSSGWYSNWESRAVDKELAKRGAAPRKSTRAKAG